MAVGEIFRIKRPSRLRILKNTGRQNIIICWTEPGCYSGGGAGPEPAGGEEGLVLVPHCQPVKVKG